MEFDDIKKIVNEILESISKINDKKEIKRILDKSSFKGVIDISLDDEIRIPKEKFTFENKLKDKRYWLLKLDLYYKNPAMRIEQLNQSTLNMYVCLCKILESYLNEKSETIARLISKLRRKGINFDIYYTLYNIALNQVLNFYNPLYNKNAERSFEILERYISREASLLIEEKAKELEKNLKAPDKEIREYFNLTENNRVSLWWDLDGKRRDKYNFSKEEVLGINQTSKRSNNLWKNKEVFEILMDLFLNTIRVIFDNDKKVRNIIINIISPYRSSKLILDAILQISERNLREKFTFFTSIKIDKSLDYINSIDDGKLLDFIEKSQKEYLEKISQEKTIDIYKNYFKKHPGKINDQVNFVEKLSIEEKISYMKEIENLPSFEKINQKLLTKENENKIIGLYYLYNLEENTKTYDKILFQVINEDNYQDFIKLVKNSKLDIKTIEEIKKLKNQKPKVININKKNLDKSRENLKKTVDLVGEFISENDDSISCEDDKKENIKAESHDLEAEIKSILNTLVREGHINLDDFDYLAKENGFTRNSYLNKINEFLFAYTSDQTLLIDNGIIIVDPFYVEIIKEYVSGN